MNCEASISFDDLYRAHLRCRKGHRHKQEIIDVELRLSEVLWALEKELNILGISSLSISVCKYLGSNESRTYNVVAKRAYG